MLLNLKKGLNLIKSSLDNQQISSVPIINVSHTTHTHAENVMLSQPVMQGLFSPHIEHVLLMYPIALATEFSISTVLHKSGKFFLIPMLN